MEYSEVIIKGLTRIQANCLAILCEDGTIANLINGHMKKMFTEDNADPEFRLIGDDMPDMYFDDDDDVVQHQATYSGS